MREKLIEILRKTRYEYRRYIGTKDMEKRMAKTEEEFCAIDDSIVGEIPFCADFLIANGVTVLPCKIGDTVWASGKQNKKPYIRQGVVSEMMYLEDMRLGIVVKFLPRYSHRGFWGKSIFATREECVAAIGGKDNE